MLTTKKNQASMLMLLGILCFGACIGLTQAIDDDPPGPVLALFMVLLLASGVLYTWGIFAYTISKGYPGALGLVGYTAIGFVVLLVLPDRSAETEGREPDREPGDWSSDATIGGSELVRVLARRRARPCAQPPPELHLLTLSSRADPPLPRTPRCSVH
jgi:hypothetical protein